MAQPDAAVQVQPRIARLGRQGARRLDGRIDAEPILRVTCGADMGYCSRCVHCALEVVLCAFIGGCFDEGFSFGLCGDLRRDARWLHEHATGVPAD
jgi:hypothetical protein